MAKKRFALVILSCLALSTWLQAQFARTYGGQSSDVPVAILPTMDGGFIVFGDTRSLPGRTWLLKLADDGSVLWEKVYVVDPSAGLRSVCATPDGGYLMAGCSPAIAWFIKTDGQGEAEWQRSIVADAPVVYSVHPSADSGYFAIGSSSAGGSDTDVWVMKISPDGDPVWEKAYGLADTEVGTCAAPTAEGGCVIAGVTISGSEGRMTVLKIDPLGALTWQRAFSITGYSNFQASAIQPASGGGFILAGSLSGNNRADGFIISLGDSGVPLWARAYAGGFHDIQAAQDGGWIATGRTGPAYDPSGILAMKVTAGGEIDWQGSFGGPFKESAAAVTETTGGGAAIAGFTGSYGAGAEDICVIRLTPGGALGTCRFSMNPGLVASTPTVTESSMSLAAREMGSVVQAGSFSLTDPAGLSRSFELCAARKLLTLSAGISVPPSSFSPELGSHVYDAGASVTINAPTTVSGSGGHYEFSRWDVDVAGSTPTFTFTITDDTVVRAQYTWVSEKGDDSDGDDGDGFFSKFCALGEIYDSPVSSAVCLFRDFRDRRLLPNRLGQAVAALYYRWSPPAARLISRSPVLKFAARIVLLPVIAIAFMVLRLGWLPALLLLAALTALSLKRVRRRLGIGYPRD